MKEGYGITRSTTWDQPINNHYRNQVPYTVEEPDDSPTGHGKRGRLIKKKLFSSEWNTKEEGGESWQWVVLMYMLMSRLEYERRSYSPSSRFWLGWIANVGLHGMKFYGALWVFMRVYCSILVICWGVGFEFHQSYIGTENSRERWVGYLDGKIEIFKIISYGFNGIGAGNVHELIASSYCL